MSSSAGSSASTRRLRIRHAVDHESSLDSDVGCHFVLFAAATHKIALIDCTEATLGKGAGCTNTALLWSSGKGPLSRLSSTLCRKEQRKDYCDMFNLLSAKGIDWSDVNIDDTTAAYAASWAGNTVLASALTSKACEIMKPEDFKAFIYC